MTASKSRMPAATQTAALVSEGSSRRCARPFIYPHRGCFCILVVLYPCLGAIAADVVEEQHSGSLRHHLSTWYAAML